MQMQWNNKTRKAFAKAVDTVFNLYCQRLSNNALVYYVDVVSSAVNYDDAVSALKFWSMLVSDRPPSPADVVSIARGILPQAVLKKVADTLWYRILAGISNDAIDPVLVSDEDIRHVVRAIGGWDQLVSSVRSGHISEVYRSFIHATTAYVNKVFATRGANSVIAMAFATQSKRNKMEQGKQNKQKRGGVK